MCVFRSLFNQKCKKHVRNVEAKISYNKVRKGDEVMRKKSLVLLITLIIMTLFGACTKETSQEKKNGEVTKKESTWEMESFSARKQEEVIPLYMKDYNKLVYEEPREQFFKTTYHLTENQGFSVLDTFSMEESTEYQFTQINTRTMETKSTTLNPEQWEIAEGVIQAIDTYGAKGYVYWVTLSNNNPKDWALEHVYVVYTDRENKKIESCEITSFFAEHGYLTEGVPMLKSDAAGHIYVIDRKLDKVFMLSKEGELIKEYIFSTRSEYSWIDSFLTEEGERIFVHQSDYGSRFVWLNTEAANIKELAVEKELRNVEEWYGIYDNVLYYELEDQLWGWNLVSGEEHCFLNYEESGITKAKQISVLFEEEWKLLVTEKQKRYLITFSEEQKEKLADIQVVNVCGNNSFLKGRVITFSRENPEYAVQYIDSYDSEDDLSRVLMEVANKKGPDVLYIPLTELENLQKNNALADWGKVLSEETLDMFYPGVVSMGTRDGKLYGLPLSVSGRTLLVNKEYWDKETWRIEDVLQILEDNPDVRGMFLDVFGQDNYFYNLRYTLGFDLENLPDITNNMTNFQTPSFQKLLKNTKEKSHNTHVMAPFESLQSGEYLGIESVVFDFVMFSSLCDKAGDKGGIVGYPTNTGAGNYIYSEGILVVNQSAVDKEGVTELVEYLFSLESQEMLEYAISVRKDTYDNKTFYNEDNGKYYLIEPDGSWTMLKTREDGSTYYEEFQDFLMHAVPCDFSDEVFDIIYEEAESYFYSDKEMEEVADVIQNRVELYLEEKQ